MGFPNNASSTTEGSCRPHELRSANPFLAGRGRARRTHRHVLRVASPSRLGRSQRDRYRVATRPFCHPRSGPDVCVLVEPQTACACAVSIRESDAVAACSTKGTADMISSWTPLLHRSTPRPALPRTGPVNKNIPLHNAEGILAVPTARPGFPVRSIRKHQPPCDPRGLVSFLAPSHVPPIVAKSADSANR